MASTRKGTRVQEIIVRAGLIDDLQTRSANAHLDKWGGSFVHVLVQLGFVDEETVTKAIATGLQMQVMHLGTVPKDPVAMAKLDAAYCEENLVYPVSLRDRVLTLAMLDPTQLKVIDEVKVRYGARVQPMLSTGSEILAAISRHYKNRDVRPDENRARRAVTTEVATSQPSAPGQVTSRMAALKGASADSMLNDILGDVGELSEAELARVQAAGETQEKAGQILRALRELLNQKGILS